MVVERRHTTLLWRWKFALANNRIKGTRIERKKLARALGDDDALAAIFPDYPLKPLDLYG